MLFKFVDFGSNVFVFRRLLGLRVKVALVPPASDYSPMRLYFNSPTVDLDFIYSYRIILYK